MSKTKQSHYFDPSPTADHAYGSISGQWEGVSFSFQTDRAVFSRKGVDPGTDLLLATVLKEEENRPAGVLDLGTGVGVMAIVLARLRPSFSVTGSDVNRRALALAEKNARLFSLETKVRFIEADGVPSGSSYSLIVCNPPIRAGKTTVYRLFREARQALADQGVLYLVIRVKQGARSAREELSLYFSRIETVARAKGYHVLKAWNEDRGEQL